MKSKKFRKAIITAGTIIPLVAAGGGLYFYYQSQRSHKSNLGNVSQKSGTNTSVASNDINDIYDKVKIFPKLDTTTLYKYVRMENGKYIITEDFISGVINFVISNMKVVDGNLHYKYELPTPSSLKITFYWSKPHTKEYWTTYTVNLSM